MASAQPALGLVNEEDFALGAAADPRAYRLSALVEDEQVSVRLRNSILLADAAGALPFPTVGDYIDAGPMAHGIMLREVRNFGMKTARELEALIAARPLLAALHGKQRAAQDDALQQRADLLALFDDDKLITIAEGEILSARLDAILRHEPYASMRFADAIDPLSYTVAQLMRIPNCGRRSATEFCALCTQYVRRRLHALGQTDLDSLAAILLGGNPFPGRNAQSDCVDQALSTPAHGMLADRLAWLLEQLDERSRQIVRRRFGIGQAAAETLEEIGATLDVTRERIRQIEAKALKQIRLRMRRAPIDALLAQEADGQWRALSEGAPILLATQLLARRARIDPYVTLAIDLLETTREAWLDEIAQALPYGWLAPEQDLAALEAAAVELDAALQGRPLPTALPGLVGPDILPLAETAAALVLKLPVLGGYVMPPRVGPRLTRLVRLHAMLAAHGRLQAVETLVSDYHAMFSDDPCSERDAEIGMDAAPHLFVETEEGVWTALGPAGAPCAPTRAVRTVGLSHEEDPGTIAHALQAALAARGPTRISDLIEDAREILPEGRSANSVGPVLLVRRELFTRALPGVYALPGQVDQLKRAMPENWPILFNAGQARLYAVARYAGEPRRIFPLWSARNEQALCKWARHSGDPTTWASLLSVADISEWGLPEAEQAIWRRLQKAEGRFLLGSSLRRNAAYERPPLDRVLAACLYAAETQSFNWIAANRLAGRKIDSHGGAGLLAVLIGLGAVEEEEASGFRWQRPHRATAQADRLAAEMAQAMNRTGSLDWLDALGGTLTDRVAAAPLEESWVDKVALLAMLHASGNSDVAMSDDPLEALLAQQRRAREAERRGAMLDWLLDESGEGGNESA